MLEFNKEFLKEINACKWLKNCGNYEDLAFDFPVQIAKNKKKCNQEYTFIGLGKYLFGKTRKFYSFLAFES